MYMSVYYDKTLREIEKVVSDIYESEDDRPDALTRAVIFMGQLDFAKHLYHDKKRSPNTRIYMGGSKAAEISSFGQALVQLLILMRTRELPFDEVFRHGIEHLMHSEWKDRKSGNGREIMGHPISGGKVSGKAYVVDHKNPIDKMPEGSIVVLEHAEPEVAELLHGSRAVVTDQGSRLCHMAVVARESGIPAVIGTGNATSLIRTGDLVMVDADEGKVTVSGK
jgi:phosphohistidine swiveling domain-containing protein